MMVIALVNQCLKEMTWFLLDRLKLYRKVF